MVFWFFLMRHDTTIRLGIFYEQSRRMTKDQNSSPLCFSLRKKVSKQMLQHFSTETLKLMGLKAPVNHLSVCKKNIKILASELL